MAEPWAPTEVIMSNFELEKEYIDKARMYCDIINSNTKIFYSYKYDSVGLDMYKRHITYYRKYRAIYKYTELS